MDYNDHATRACDCALSIQRDLAVLNEDRNLRNKKIITVGIGINTGIAIVGNLGSTRRMEFTVIGDSVNLASRIQGAAQGGQILVGEQTRHQIKDRFETRPIGSQTFKGKSEPVQLYEIISINAKLHAKSTHSCNEN